MTKVDKVTGPSAHQVISVNCTSNACGQKHLLNASYRNSVVEMLLEDLTCNERVI